MGYVTWMDRRIWKENAVFANLTHLRILGPSRMVCIKLYDGYMKVWGGGVASNKIKKYPNARSVRVFINFVHSKLKVNCACTLMNCINATLMEIHLYITFIVIHLATFYWLYDHMIKI